MNRRRKEGDERERGVGPHLPDVLSLLRGVTSALNSTPGHDPILSGSPPRSAGSSPASHLLDSAPRLEPLHFTPPAMMEKVEAQKHQQLLSNLARLHNSSVGCSTQLKNCWRGTGCDAGRDKSSARPDILSAPSPRSKRVLGAEEGRIPPVGHDIRPICARPSDSTRYLATRQAACSGNEPRTNFADDNLLARSSVGLLS